MTLGAMPVVTRIVLASASPRRHELLERMGIAFDTVAPDVDESVLGGEEPRRYVERIARAKAAAVVVSMDTLVIAADTTVDLDGRIFGKPVDLADARRMLRALSARTHRVHTGVAISRGGRTLAEVVTTMVTMTPLTESSIDWYLATAEAMDKAGAYALQGAAGVFVHRIRGSVSNVVGLPLATVARLACDLGVDLLAGDQETG